tara:strand:+ start:471 stop:656 length:186 start_codon:yes stop_codon:yes gene_type:complete
MNIVDKNYKIEKVIVPRNIAIECRTALNKAQKHLSKKLGFHLTQNQTITYLINNYVEENRL